MHGLDCFVKGQCTRTTFALARTATVSLQYIEPVEGVGNEWVGTCRCVILSWNKCQSESFRTFCTTDGSYKAGVRMHLGWFGALAFLLYSALSALVAEVAHVFPPMFLRLDMSSPCLGVYAQETWMSKAGKKDPVKASVSVFLVWIIWRHPQSGKSSTAARICLVYVITPTDTQGCLGVDLCSLRQWRSDGGLWSTVAQTAWPFANCRGSAHDMNQRLFVFPTAKGLT